MTEEEKKALEESEKSGDGPDYISAIAELKKTTVSRDDYDKVQQENKKLLDAIINGEGVEQKGAKEEEVDIEGLRKDLFGGKELSNLEYAEKSLKLRDALIAKGEQDPFLPCGSKCIPTEEDIACADRVAKVLKECVEDAEGDSVIFTKELQRRTIDVQIH